MSSLPKKLRKQPLSSGTLRPEDVAVKPKPSLTAPGVGVKRPILKGAASQSTSALGIGVKKQKLDFGLGGNGQPELFATSTSQSSVPSTIVPPRPSVEHDDLKAFCSKGKCDEFDDASFVVVLDTAIAENKFNKACRLIVAALLRFVHRGQESGKLVFDPMICAHIARVAAQNADKLTNAYVFKCIFWCLSVSKTWSVEKQQFLTSLLTRLAEAQRHIHPYFALAFLSDCLGERIWADKPHCSRLVSLILRRFDTRFPTSAMYKDTNGELNPPTWVPDMTVEDKFPANQDGLPEAEREKEKRRRRKEREKEGSREGGDDKEKEEDDDIPLKINVVEDVLSYLRRWWEMRGDAPSRALLRTMAVFSGLDEVRNAASKRLDVWLQNPKVQRQALDLLLIVSINIRDASEQDAEALSNILKMRSLKSKQVQSVFNAAIAVLAQSEVNARAAVKALVNNELGPQQNRSPLNMYILQPMFAANNHLITKLIAEELCSIVVSRSVMMKAACILVKELSRSHLRADFWFSRFLIAFLDCVHAIMMSGDGIDDQVPVTATSVCNMIVWTGITPQVKEAFAQRRHGEITPVYTRFCQELTDYFASALKWVRQSRILFNEMKEYISTLYSLMFLDKGTHLLSLEGGPSELEWAGCQRIINEVPLTSNLLKYVMSENYCEAADIMQILNLMTDRVLRGVPVDHTYSVVEDGDVSLIDSLFEVSKFSTKQPTLPKQQLNVLSVREPYWRAFYLAFLWASCSKSQVLLKQTHDKYPTVAMFMHMAIINDFSYTCMKTGRKAEELETREKLLSEADKREALKIESMLCGGVRVDVTRSRMVSLCILTNPTGQPRCPPMETLAEVEHVSKERRLGARLCESREPDILAELVAVEGGSRAIHSVSEFLSTDPAAVDNIPIECVCEFLLYKLQHPEENETDKMQMMMVRLRACVNDAGDGKSATQATMLLFEKLASRSQSERNAAFQILTSLKQQDASSMEVCEATALPLSKISELPHFAAMRDALCSSLAEACLQESDAGRIKQYITFVNNYAHMETESTHVIANTLASIVRRADKVFKADLVEFYARYLHSATKKSNDPAADQAGVCVVVNSEGKKIILDPQSVSAQLELVCSLDSEDGGEFKKQLVDFWFPKDGGSTPSTLIDGKTKSILSEELRANMLCTDDHRILSVALDGVTPGRALKMICRFGLNTTCASQLLALVDKVDFGKVNFAEIEKARCFVAAYRARGASGGQTFMKNVEKEVEKRANIKDECEEVLQLDPVPRTSELAPPPPSTVLSPKELTNHIRVLMSQDQMNFSLGTLEMRSILADEKTAVACLEQLEGNLKYFLEHPNAFLLMLLMLNTAAEKFPAIHSKLCAWAGKVLKATQPPENVLGILKRFAPQVAKGVQRTDSIGKMNDPAAVLALLSSQTALTQLKQQRLLNRYTILRPEIVDVNSDVDTQVKQIFSGTRNGLPWLAVQIPLIASPETLRAVLHSILSQFQPSFNTQSVLDLLLFCACEGDGVVCNGLKQSQLSVAIEYMVQHVSAKTSDWIVMMKIVDALVDVLGFDCLRTMAETCSLMNKSATLSGDVKNSAEEMLNKLQLQFPCLHADRMRGTAVVEGVRWRLAEADRKATQYIGDVFKNGKTEDCVRKTLTSLNTIRNAHPKVIERHLGVLSRLLAELVTISTRELRDSPKRPVVQFAVSCLSSVLPVSDESSSDDIDSLFAVLIAYFERHLLGTRLGGSMAEDLLQALLRYMDTHYERARSLILENAESIRMLCEARPDSFFSTTVREVLNNAMKQAALAV